MSYRYAVETDLGVLWEETRVHTWVGTVTGRSVAAPVPSQVVVVRIDGDFVTVLRHRDRHGEPVRLVLGVPDADADGGEPDTLS